MMSLCWYHGDLEDQRATMRITGRNEEIPLTLVRLRGMKIPPNEALDMSGSLYLIISYLLKNE